MQRDKGQSVGKRCFLHHLLCHENPGNPPAVFLWMGKYEWTHADYVRLCLCEDLFQKILVIAGKPLLIKAFSCIHHNAYVIAANQYADDIRLPENAVSSKHSPQSLDSKTVMAPVFHPRFFAGFFKLPGNHLHISVAQSSVIHAQIMVGIRNTVS